MKRDDLIFDIIEKEHQRQLKGIELIASENFVSDQVMEAMGSCLTNKYAEGYPGKRYYGGCEVVDQSEQIAIDRLKQIFGAEWANVQPHSGAQANAAVFLAVLNPGDKFMGLNLAHGGHLSHGSLVNTSGIIYTPCEYNLNQETGRVDYDQMEEVALRERPKMIIGGGSAYSREWDYKRMREIADKVGAILMIDMAHPAGLIAAGLLDNPVKYAHIVTSTTHKTLRGPRGGVIMMGKDFPNPWGKTTPKGEIKMMSQLLDSAVFPGIQGGPLEHVIAAKAVAFGECLQPEYKEYQKQVQKNAAVLAQALLDGGEDLVKCRAEEYARMLEQLVAGLLRIRALNALAGNGCCGREQLRRLLQRRFEKRRKRRFFVQQIALVAAAEGEQQPVEAHGLLLQILRRGLYDLRELFALPPGVQNRQAVRFFIRRDPRSRLHPLGKQTQKLRVDPVNL